MVPSAAGILVFITLLVIGRLAGSAIIVGLFASLAFGSTAIVSMPALGSSSPLIYAAFALLLVARAALRRDFTQALGLVFRQHITAFVACTLVFYAFASAIILPALFAGDVSALVPIDGIITEVRLAPSGGNITQTAYLVVGIAAFFSLRILLLDFKNIKTVRSGLFAYVIANVLLGLIDLGGKLAGLGDWLFPIRSAGFALLIDVEASGFWRIAGGYSEASSFAISCLACIAFVFMYWRWTASKLALFMTLVLFALLLFSTSTTAYVGLAVLVSFAAISVCSTFFTGRMKFHDLLLFTMLLLVSASGLGLYLYNENLYEPLRDLIQTMVFEKANSDSGQERSYWNEISLQNFIETYGLGIGMGSSRSSSWFVSVLSQLGIFGALLFGAILAAIFNGAGSIRVSCQSEIYALVTSARAMTIGWLTGICIAGSSADPGLLVFLALAIVLGCKHHLRPNLRRQFNSVNLSHQAQV
jgi:hypothetical protein